MSLEAVIADNTSAIRELIAALTASAKAPPAFDVGEPGAPEAAATATAIQEAAEAATAIQEAVTARPTPAKTKASPPPAPTPPTAAAPAPTTYNDVVAAVTKVAKAKGRDAAVAVFRAFGVDNGKELKPEQYAAVVAACAKAAE